MSVVHGGEVRVEDGCAPPPAAAAAGRYDELELERRRLSPFMLARGDRKPLTSVCPFCRAPFMVPFEPLPTLKLFGEVKPPTTPGTHGIVVMLPNSSGERKRRIGSAPVPCKTEVGSARRAERRYSLISIVRLFRKGASRLPAKSSDRGRLGSLWPFVPPPFELVVGDGSR